MKLIKRMTQTSYYLEEGKLYLVNNFSGIKRLATVFDRGGREFNRDVGFVDELGKEVVKEAFSEIPEIQFIRKVAPEVIKEKIVEESSVKPAVEPNVKDVTERKSYNKLSDDVVKGIIDDYTSGIGSSRIIAKKWGVSYSIVMRYVRKSGVEYRAVSGRKKAPTS